MIIRCSEPMSYLYTPGAPCTAGGDKNISYKHYLHLIKCTSLTSTFYKVLQNSDSSDESIKFGSKTGSSFVKLIEITEAF